MHLGSGDIAIEGEVADSMKPGYRYWLEQRKYEAGTVNAQLYRAGRVEEFHGNLDEHYDKDRMASLIEMLRYSSDDRRRNRPNPSKIPFDGDIHNNLASYRNAAERYRTFRDEIAAGADVPVSEEGGPDSLSTICEGAGPRIGLERDLQAALRADIGQLEPGLIIVDGGAERSVDSGFIDITARDAEGAIVVIELKAGAVGQRAVAQILSYMGDVAAEEDNQKVRGILVGSNFDGKAKSAARMVSSLILRKYSVRFTFSDGHA